MNSPDNRMIEFLHFLQWVKGVDRSKKTVMVNPIDPENPFVAIVHEEEIKYGWATTDAAGVYSIEFE